MGEVHIVIKPRARFISVLAEYLFAVHALNFQIICRLRLQRREKLEIIQKSIFFKKGEAYFVFIFNSPCSSPSPTTCEQ